MPYGDLAGERARHFATRTDLEAVNRTLKDRARCQRFPHTRGPASLLQSVVRAVQIFDHVGLFLCRKIPACLCGPARHLHAQLFPRLHP